MIPAKLLDPRARLPTKSYLHDAGWDLYALEDVYLNPARLDDWAPRKVRTGLALQLPQGLCGLICDRSSLGSKGIKVMGGVIDASYRGEVIVCLMNLGKRLKIDAGDRIAQLLLLPVPQIGSFHEVAELEVTARDIGGFGSTGK